ADRTVYLTDGYFGICGAHEIYFNNLARHLAPVRLSGVFGSEVFRGVSTFKPLALTPTLLSPKWLSASSECVRNIEASNHPVSFAAFEEIRWSIFGSVAACRSQVTFR